MLKPNDNYIFTLIHYFVLDESLVLQAKLQET